MYKVFTSWIKRNLSEPEAIGIVIFIIAAVIVLETMGNILAPLIAGGVITYMLSGIVQKLQAWKIPHLLAVSMVFLLFLALFLFIFIWLLPLLWEQLNNLFAEIPNMVAHAQSLYAKVAERYPEYFTAVQWQQISGQITSYIANYGKAVLSFSLNSILSVAAIVVYLVLVPFLVFFFLRDSKIILGWGQRFLPAKRDTMSKIWTEVQCQIGSYIKGKAIEVIIITFVSIIGFAILQLHYAVLLGVLVGLSVVIPYVGFVVVTVPLVIVGLIQWGLIAHFWYLMIFYLVVSIIDANVLVPLLFAETMNLHPVAIILAVLIFGTLGGFWGIFFAIPLMTFCNTLIKFWPKRSDVGEEKTP